MTDPAENSPNPRTDKDGERIAKVLARVGIASRREIERMIDAGRITLDGRTIESPATFISSLDGLKVDGVAVASGSETRLWRFHKRRGLLTTHNDPEGRPTVFEALPDHMPRVISAGRLDMNTEGLLLLTNDGALARWLELPETALARRYRVRVHGRVTEAKLASVKDGVTIDGVHYGPIDARIDKVTGTNAWVIVTIHEGKNREVRRVMEHLGLDVNRLVRTHYGPFSLGTLPQGAVDRVSQSDLTRGLPDFFSDQGQNGPAAPALKKADSSKWAKAKKTKGGKPNSRKHHTSRSKDTSQGGNSTGKKATNQTGSQKPSGRKRGDDATTGRRGQAEGRSGSPPGRNAAAPKRRSQSKGKP